MRMTSEPSTADAGQTIDCHHRQQTENRKNPTRPSTASKVFTAGVAGCVKRTQLASPSFAVERDLAGIAIEQHVSVVSEKAYNVARGIHLWKSVLEQ